MTSEDQADTTTTTTKPTPNPLGTTVSQMHRPFWAALKHQFVTLRGPGSGLDRLKSCMYRYKSYIGNNCEMLETSILVLITVPVFPTCPRCSLFTFWKASHFYLLIIPMSVLLLWLYLYYKALSL